MEVLESVKSNHISSFVSELKKMMEDEFICDFIIKVDETEFPVHRVVLAGTSKYFKAMFSSNMKEVKKGFVKIVGVESLAMRKSIDFMYTGAAEVTSDNVEEILSAATLMQLDGLVDLCFDFLVTRIDVGSCLRALRLSSLYDRDYAMETAEDFIVENFQEVIREPQFPTISKEDLLRYITLSDIGHEISWQAVINWMGDDIDTKKEHFSELLQFLKISEFSFEIIFKAVQEESILKSFPDMKTCLLEQWTTDLEAFKGNLCPENYYNAKKIVEENVLPNKDDLSKQLVGYFARNFSSLWKRNEFLELHEEDILPTFRNTKYQHFSDETKWLAAIKWVKHNENRKKIFRILFETIDLNLLSRDFIRREVINDTLVKELSHYKDELLARGYCDPQPPCHIACLDPIAGEITLINPSEKNYQVMTRVRKGIGIVSVNGYLYLVTERELLRWNKHEEWTALPSPSGRFIVSKSRVVNCGNYIYIVTNDKIHCFNTTSNHWQGRPRPLSTNKGACIVATDDSLYAIGGEELNLYKQISRYKEAKKVNPSLSIFGLNWTYVQHMQDARSHASGVYHRGMIWVMGGGAMSVEVYHPLSNVWTMMGYLTSSREKFASCIVRNKLYIIGGTGAKGSPGFSFGGTNSSQSDEGDAIEVYQEASRSWITTQTFKPLLGNPSCCPYSPPAKTARTDKPLTYQFQTPRFVLPPS